MKREGILVLVIAILLTFVLSDSIKKVAADDNREPSVKIGFINLKNVFRDFKKVKEMEQEINRETETEMSKIKELEEQVKQLKEEIPLYRPGTPMRKRKEQELTDKLFEIKFKKDKASYFFAEKMKAGIERVYQDISQEVELYAKQNDFYMIVRVADADFFGAQTADALRMEINTRDVLYWGKKYDITSIIIAEMDKKYQAEKSSFDKNKEK